MTTYQNRNIFQLLLLLSLCIAGTVNAQTNIKVYADPESTPGIKASKFIDKIDFIPLETSAASLFQSPRAFKLAGDQIVIHDDQDNGLYFFDKHSGKFLHHFKNDKRRYKIAYYQYAPDKRAILVTSKNNHYTISRKKSLQLTKRWKDKNISKYIQHEWIYLDDNYKTKKSPVPSIALNDHLTYFNGDFIYRNYTTDHYTSDSVLYRFVQYDNHQKIKHQYFPFLNLKALWSDYYTYNLPLAQNSTISDSTMLLQVDFDPTIYELRPDTIIEKYRFVFPMKNMLPAAYSSLSFRNEIDFQKYKDQNIAAFSDNYKIIEHDKVLIFAINSLNHKHREFLLLNNILYDYNKVITDSSIHNLPPSILREVFGQDKDYIYAVFSPAAILKQKEAILKDATISQSFKDYLSAYKEDENYNQILLRIKLK